MTASRPVCKHSTISTPSWAKAKSTTPPKTSATNGSPNTKSARPATSAAGMNCPKHISYNPTRMRDSFTEHRLTRDNPRNWFKGHLIISDQITREGIEVVYSQLQDTLQQNIAG